MNCSHVSALLAKIIGVDYWDIGPDTKLTPDYKVEAIDIAKLVIACEKHFNVVIHDEDVHTFECVNDIAKYIDNALGEGHDGPLAHSEKDREDWFYI